MHSTSYPHRVFQLSVVIAAVSQVTFGRDAVEVVATRYACARSSLSRWISWVAQLVDPAQVLRVCARLDPDGVANSVQAQAGTVRERAGAVVCLLDRLVTILRERGSDLPGHGVGLERLLTCQLVRFGDVRPLKQTAPPLDVRLRALRL